MRYSAVVESGWCDRTYTYWEEKRNCGHKHKTVEAAQKCGAKLYDSRREKTGWTANADWHGYVIHDQEERRVS
jgi:hypothetical protein